MSDGGPYETGETQPMSAIDDSDNPTPLLSEEYDPTVGEQLSVRIVRLVAVASDRKTSELEPLGRTIDVEALGQLVNAWTFTDREATIEVSFDYEGYLVEIETNGTVNICVEE